MSFWCTVLWADFSVSVFFVLFCFVFWWLKYFISNNWQVSRFRCLPPLPPRYKVNRVINPSSQLMTAVSKSLPVDSTLTANPDLPVYTFSGETILVYNVSTAEQGHPFVRVELRSVGTTYM